MKREESEHEEKEKLPDSFVGLPFKTYTELAENRLILLNGEVKENVIERVVIPILQMTKDNPTEPIAILINSFGGTVEDAQNVVDIIRSSHCWIKTKVLGKAMSAAFDIFMAGDERSVYQNSILMCHSGSEKHGTMKLPDVNIEAALYQKYYQRWASFYASRSNVSKSWWLKVLKSGKDRYIFPEEALELGITHKIEKHIEKKNDTTNRKSHKKSKRIPRKLGKKQV